MLKLALFPGSLLSSLGTLSIDDESDDEDEPEVILTDKTILRMSCFVFVTLLVVFTSSRT